jgi:DNA polymerase III epsilon subunit-like protein
MVPRRIPLARRIRCTTLIASSPAEGSSSSDSLAAKMMGASVYPRTASNRRNIGNLLRQVVVVDTETTGLGHNNRPPRPDAIVQIGYAWRNTAGKVIRWSNTCNPGAAYLRGGRASEALRINGLSLDMILAAPSAQAVAAEFRDQLDRVRDESGLELEIRSYNRRFDEPFLRVRPWRVPSSLWGPCLTQAAQEHLGHWKWPKLHEAVNLMGIQPPPGRSHTAAVDSHAALLIHERLSTRSGR